MIPAERSPGCMRIDDRSNSERGTWVGGAVGSRVKVLVGGGAASGEADEESTRKTTMKSR